MSKLEIFKDEGFDTKADNNFKKVEGKENQENADDLTKQQRSFESQTSELAMQKTHDLIDGAKKNMENLAKKEQSEADDILAGLTGEIPKDKKPDENLQKHLAQGTTNIVDANGDGIPDAQQTTDTNQTAREDEELQAQQAISKPTEKKNSVLTEHSHSTQFGKKPQNGKDQTKPSAEGGAEKSGGLE